jgi:hypothetical protein
MIDSIILPLKDLLVKNLKINNLKKEIILIQKLYWGKNQLSL